MRNKLQRLKSNLWTVFSLYIRQRDADENGMVSCISCDKSMHWKESNAGHYYPKSLGLSVYFVEKNVHNQCPNCNLKEQGNQYKYGLALVKRYGEGVLEELERIKNTTLKYSRSDYEELIEKYKGLIK